MQEKVLNHPQELLEVLTPDGLPTGKAKTRRQVHLDGDWHRAAYCWIARGRPSGPQLLLQRRSLTKDTWPGRFDASAAGHIRFGEDGAIEREIEEELGIAVHPSHLVRLGRHPQEHRHPNGIIDREYHELHLLPLDLPLEAFRPDPREVTALAWAPAEALALLSEGRLPQVPVELGEFTANGLRLTSGLLGPDDIVPYRPPYYATLAAAARRLLKDG